MHDEPTQANAGQRPVDRSSARRSIASMRLSSKGSSTVIFEYSIVCEIGKAATARTRDPGRQAPQVHDPRGRSAALTRRR